MDQSQNNNSNPPSDTPVTPPVTPPTVPSTPSTPVAPPSVDLGPPAAPGTGPVPDTVPPAPESPVVDPVVPPPSDTDRPQGSPMKKILFLLLGLVLVGALVFAGYQYMNAQSAVPVEESAIAPTESVEMEAPQDAMMMPSEAQPTEEEVDAVDIGSEEAQITDIQNDVNGL